MATAKNEKAYTEALEHHLIEARGAAEELIEAVEAYIVHLDNGTVNWGYVGSLEHATNLMGQAIQALRDVGRYSPSGR